MNGIRIARGELCTPLGTWSYAATEKGLAFLSPIACDESYARFVARIGGEVEVVDEPQWLAAIETQLTEYAAGTRRAFDLPLDLHGTEFELRVWNALLEIPYGETRSYGELAQGLGDPGAARAVGGANGRNPVPIVVPCHRVVASNGLGGYSGGDGVKETLLAHEGALLFG